MNKKGQLGDILEFKISFIILIIVLIITLFLFLVPKASDYLFGEDRALREVKVSYNLKYDQYYINYDKILADFLNEKSSIGTVSDLIALKDENKIKEELKNLKYDLMIEYSDGKKIETGGSGLVGKGIIIPDLEGKPVKVILVDRYE